jgi:hypothetical protein
MMRMPVELFVAGAALLMACESSPKKPVEGVTTTGAGVVSNRDVVTRLAAARCEHARMCNEFGPDRDYADDAGCKSQISHDLEGDFRPSECPHGVREERLTSCLNEVKNEKCGDLSGKIRRVTSCRKSDLCIE